MSITYLLRVKLELRPTRQWHENRLFMNGPFPLPFKLTNCNLNSHLKNDSRINLLI